MEAVRKLVDQEILADVAKTDDDSVVRLGAAMKLTDQDLAQNVFADAVKNDYDHVVRKYGNRVKFRSD